MAVSKEWEYMHLTPNGWVQGSARYDFQGTQKVEEPKDTVLTVYRRVEVGAIGAKAHVEESQTPHIDDQEEIDSLLEKYGPPKFGV